MESSPGADVVVKMLRKRARKQKEQQDAVVEATLAAASVLYENNTASQVPEPKNTVKGSDEEVLDATLWAAEQLFGNEKMSNQPEKDGKSSKKHKAGNPVIDATVWGAKQVYGKAQSRDTSHPSSNTGSLPVAWNGLDTFEKVQKQVWFP